MEDAVRIGNDFVGSLEDVTPEILNNLRWLSGSYISQIILCTPQRTAEAFLD